MLTACRALCVHCVLRLPLPRRATQVRRAVGLGRQHLDPLAVVASLCGPDQEVASLRLTDVESALTAEERMRAVERVMVTAVAQVRSRPAWVLEVWGLEHGGNDRRGRVGWERTGQQGGAQPAPRVVLQNSWGCCVVACQRRTAGNLP